MSLNIKCCNDLIEKAKGMEFDVCAERSHLLPTIFNKNWDENFISDWLAFILNPAVNSIGITPINLLLALSTEGTSEKAIAFSESAEVNIGQAGEYSRCRECYLDDDKHNRIDLLFKVEENESKYLIAIENKVYSGQTKDDQLEQYCNFIEMITKSGSAGYPGYEGCEPIMIYLTRAKDEESVKGTKFRPVSHKEFIDRLKGIPLNYDEHMRESFLIDEYIKNMEEYIMPEDKTIAFTEDEARFFAENYRLINQISARKEDFNFYIRDKVYKTVRERCFGNEYVQQPENDPGKNTWCLWYRQGEKSGLHCEILFGDGKNLFDRNGYINVRAAIHNEISQNENEYREKVNQIMTDITTHKKLTAPMSKVKITSLEDVEKFANDIREQMKALKETYEKIIDELKQK